MSKVRTTRRIGAAAAAAVAVAVLSPAAAQAAGSYGGDGSTVNISTYNYYYTSFLPSPPSTVPATSTITSVSYNLSYYAPGFPPGVLDANLCSTTSNCTKIYNGGGSTSYFNGLPGNTPLQIKVRWSSATLSGSVKGGVQVSDSISVAYS